MYVINDKNERIRISVDEILEKIEKWNPKVVKIIENPENDNELRIYVDDFMFINCWHIEEITTEEKIYLIKNIKCENMLYMKDELWEETLYWATSRFDFGYLMWDTKMDDWWNEAPDRIKEKWTKQYKALLNTKCFLKH